LGARGDKILLDTGEEPLGDLASARHEGVQVTRLGDALAELWPFGETVPLDHRHRLETVGEHPGGKKPRHAAPDNDGVAARFG
jgi:hypothetical protein